MSSEINYKKIKTYCEKYRYSERKYYNVLIKMEELIDINVMELFYPKNIFSDNNKVEFYIFFEDKILRGKISKNTDIEIKTFKFQNIIDFKFECDFKNQGFCRLTIKFKSEEVIVFDSIEDANETWCYEFGNKIREIYKFILKNY